MAIILDAFQSTFTSRKKDGESLQNYTRLFNMSTKILEFHLGGQSTLEKYVNTIEGYNKKLQTKTNTVVKQDS